MMFIQQGRRQIRHRVCGNEVIGRAGFGKIVNVNAVFLRARVDRQPERVVPRGAVESREPGAREHVGEPLDRRDLARAIGAGPSILMRGHGATVAAPNVRHAVFISIYLEVNAKLQFERGKELVRNQNIPQSTVDQREADEDARNRAAQEQLAGRHPSEETVDDHQHRRWNL